MHVLVNFELKKGSDHEQLRKVETSILRRSRADSFVASGGVEPKFEFIQAFMHVLVTTMYQKDRIKTTEKSFLFVWVEALRPSQQFFSHVGTELPLPGYDLYLFWEVNVSCSRIQHGDLSDDRAPDLSLQSPKLYH